jgi:protein arginine N-methyltransferase 1
MHLYSVAGHGAMIADDVRVEAYARAIERTVRPGDAVLEIGAGTGLFSMLACKAGARRVYAVEADDIIEIARANAQANGLADRIEFIQGISTEVELPERVDMIVSDLRGILPYFEGHIPSIADARKRFLARGGTLVPREDRVMLACVEVFDEYKALASPWARSPAGLRLDPARDFVFNDWRKIELGAGQVVSEPLPCAVLDYAGGIEAGFRSRLSLTASRDATCHGLGLWFESVLAEGIGFTCAPGAEPRSNVYGQAFYPWPRPLPLREGEALEVAIEARLVGGSYVWSWETCRGEDRFKQSTFHAEPLAPAKLRARSAAHVPSIGVEARVDRFMLESMERGSPLGEIATQARALFPERFARWEDALTRAGELAERYSG